MMPTPSGKRPRSWLRLGQTIVTIGLVWWLLTRVDWANLRFAFDNLIWPRLILGLLFVLASHLINIARWRFLMPPNRPNYLPSMVFYGAGLFSNNFLPTGFGGDAIRSTLLSRRIPCHPAIFSVLLDRGIGIISLSALLGIGLFLGLSPAAKANLADLIQEAVPGKSLLPIFCSLAVVVLLALLVTRTYFPDLLSRKIKEKVFDFAGKLTSVPLSFKDWLKLFAGGYLFSVVSQSVLAIAYWEILLAMGINVGFSGTIWLVLLVSLSLFFPLALNGLGVQEATFVWTLGIFGVASTPAFLVALLVRSIGVVFSLAGGIGWLIGGDMRERRFDSL
jgi:glycosyltransferase 2 family protein